ncbi:MAG: enoyl-CoA hydratase/isomerase family protein [Hyphomicrobiaceae bacterium]|nr:enoyl-CoA hydratase/isomerase family protein [Hyphomicrobiaceae bacterium]
MTTPTDSSAAGNEAPAVRIAVDGAAAKFTLDRPRALNALDVAMRTAMSAALPAFTRDPEVYALIITSASDRAFCAGGDVRELVALYRNDPAAARRALADEYALDWQLECFAKPSVALIDGVVMGSGVGLTAYNTHRVAGERYSFAMPETMLGLFPDVGVAHVLAGLPDHLGVYLGLTGHAIGRADAYALGLVTHCSAAARFGEIIAALEEAWPVDPVLDERHEAPGPPPLDAHRATIAKVFSAPTVGEILSRLRTVSGRDADWARRVEADLRAAAPLSLAVTLRHIREAASLDLRSVLARDYRLACRFLEGHDFAEGVRALLIDKDKAPRWQPSRIEDVTEAMVEACFAPLAEGELLLPERRLMQEPAP